MAYLKVQTKSLDYRRPTVDMIMRWLVREYDADIRYLHANSEVAVFEVASNELPASKYIDVTLTELVPRVLIVNVNEQII